MRNNVPIVRSTAVLLAAVFALLLLLQNATAADPGFRKSPVSRHMRPGKRWLEAANIEVGELEEEQEDDAPAALARAAPKKTTSKRRPLAVTPIRRVTTKKVDNVIVRLTTRPPVQTTPRPAPIIPTTARRTTTVKMVNGCPVYPVSGDSTCGSAVGLSCAPGQCCSQYGYCGLGDDWCGTGCQNGEISSGETSLDKSNKKGV